MRTRQSISEAWSYMGCPIICEAEIIAMRKEIEAGEIHRGAKRVLVLAAYNEIRTRQGMVTREMNCGSTCMGEINRQLKIWLAIYDARTKHQHDLAAQNITQLRAEQSGQPVPNTDLTLSQPGEHTNDGKHEELEPVKKMSDREQVLRDIDFWDLCKMRELLPEESQELLKSKTKNGVNKKDDIINELLKHNL